MLNQEHVYPEILSQAHVFQEIPSLARVYLRTLSRVPVYPGILSREHVCSAVASREMNVCQGIQSQGPFCERTTMTVNFVFPRAASTPHFVSCNGCLGKVGTTSPKCR